MSTARCCALLVFLTAGLASAAPPPGPAQPADASQAARAALTRWLKAQNDGDFASYQALYAARFTGIRRSGPRVVHLNRPRWMADRERMFRNKMSVAATDVVVQPAPGMVRVRFTQTWENATYKDVGPKELLLVPQGNGLQIAREELLASALRAMDRPDTAAAPQPGDFAFVSDGGVVIDCEHEESWGQGAPVLRTSISAEPSVAVRKVDVSKLPPAVAAWRGKRLRVFGDRGAACLATVSGFELRASVIPHFGTLEDWKTLDAAAQARAVWESGSTVLIGTLDNAECTGSWARFADLPTRQIVPAIEADPALRAAALAAIHQEKEYRDILASYREQGHPRAPTWEEAAPSVIHVLTMNVREGQRPVTLVSVTLDSGGGCGEFEGGLWALYEQASVPGAPPKLKLRQSGAPILPKATVDLDGDGDWELLYEKGTISLHDSVPRVPGLLRAGYRKELDYTFLDCPC